MQHLIDIKAIVDSRMNKIKNLLILNLFFQPLYTDGLHGDAIAFD